MPFVYSQFVSYYCIIVTITPLNDSTDVLLLKARETRSLPEHLTLQVLEMLPTVHCIKPKTALSLMSREEADIGSRVVMDQEVFENVTFQRVYQYLRRYAAGNNLDRFSYQRDSIEGTPQDCLKIFLRLGKMGLDFPYITVVL